MKIVLDISYAILKKTMGAWQKSGSCFEVRMKQGKAVVVTYRNGSRKAFPSVTAAAVVLNVSASTLRSRLKEWQPIQSLDDIRRIEYAEVQE